MSKPRRIGYIRLAPTDHYPNVQADALQEAGSTELHEAKGQEGRKEPLDLLCNGDTLIVYRLDRLARDEQSVVNFQRQLEAMGVTLVVTSDHERGSNDNAG